MFPGISCLFLIYLCVSSTWTVERQTLPNRVNRAHWPTKEHSKILTVFAFFRSMEKMTWDGPKWGREGLFLANPDLADILGRTHLDFEHFHFCFFWIPNFWMSRSPDFQNLAPGRAWAKAVSLANWMEEPSGPKKY